ncbi:MAG TPA: LysR substrate-binding domain-containing protein [Oligoflexus sp.]|uniref:LysR family transcriptional regulator n=1 Tax=Oligoflexus sp. TaxID=1971216 RepID=UPI002D241149|nr:LysR substrate-binding domain-containing protein [Oligoflexus sp.]HYX36499.1 LysR substrate-binding domain-containing protein [Oligoflexus sp.]
MFHLDDLILFAEIVKQGSFTSAASRLGISKSFLSEKLSELESHFGVKLLRRTTRRLSLTEEGETAFAEALEMIERAEKLENLIAGHNLFPKGRIRITASIEVASEILAPALAIFAKLHPQIAVDILATDTVLDHVKDKIDIAIRIGKIQDSNLIQKKIGNTFLGIFASVGYLASLEAEPHHLQQLQRHSIYSFHRRQSLVLSGKEEKGEVAISNRIQIDSITVLKTFCLSGGGFCVLPVAICETALQQGILRRILPDWSFAPVPLYYIYEKSRSQAARFMTFMNFMTPVLVKALDAK